MPNFNEPMTREEAVDKHMCNGCLQGEPCGHDCVLSATCSVPCPYCSNSVFFDGDIEFAVARPVCPYCGNPFNNVVAMEARRKWRESARR